MYGFANGDPATFSDPFGLCPPKDTNVGDCDTGTTLGQAWVALDGAGTAGKRVIQGVVDGGLNVETGEVGGASCESENACFNPTTKTITLNQGLSAGGMAVTIAHEYTHSTQSRPQSYDQYARNELAAWDAMIDVHRGLQQPYKGQAAATPHSGGTYGAVFQYLGTMSGRQGALQQWRQRARQLWPGFH